MHSQAQIDQIIQKFAAHEAELAKARENYVYKQTARIQELDDSGNTTGRWETVSDIIFSSDGRRTISEQRSRRLRGSFGSQAPQLPSARGTPSRS